MHQGRWGRVGSSLASIIFMGLPSALGKAESGTVAEDLQGHWTFEISVSGEERCRREKDEEGVIS